MNIKTRLMQPPDYPLLENFLYHAIYIPNGEEMPSRQLIFDTEIYVYIKDFGGEDDNGVVAELGEKII